MIKLKHVFIYLLNMRTLPRTGLVLRQIELFLHWVIFDARKARFFVTRLLTFSFTVFTLVVTWLKDFTQELELVELSVYSGIYVVVNRNS